MITEHINRLCVQSSSGLWMDFRRFCGLSPGDCFRCVRPMSGEREREPAMRCCGSVQRHIGPRGPVPICAYVQCLRQSRASLTHTEHVHVRLWLFACVCVRFMVNNRFARVSALILCVVVGASDAHTRKKDRNNRG